MAYVVQRLVTNTSTGLSWLQYYVGSGPARVTDKLDCARLWYALEPAAETAGTLGAEWWAAEVNPCEACGSNAGDHYYSLGTCADGVGVCVCEECIELGDDIVRALIVERARPDERCGTCDEPEVHHDDCPEWRG